MPDPVTLGTLVAAALSAGAIEAGKAILGATAKDSYEQLKALASRLIGPSATDLEAKPESGARFGVVAEKVEELAPPDQTKLKALAEALRAALAAEGRADALTTTFNQFNAYDNARQFIAQGGAQYFGGSAGKADDDA